MSETSTANTLDAALAQLEADSPACLIYETRAEQAAAAAAFLVPALAHGAQGVLAMEAEAAEAALQALQARGVDTAEARQAGALRVASETNARAAQTFCESVIAEARAAGYAGARIALEAAWAYGGGLDPANLLAHEADLRGALHGKPARLLSLYDRGRCTAQTLLRVINAHAVVVWQGRACHNPCYIPPAQPAGPGREAQAVERLLGSLRAWEENRQVLAETEARQRVILSEIAEAVFITDDEGRLVYVYPNVSTIFGYAPDEAQALGDITALLGERLYEPGALNATGVIHDIERRIVDKAGQLHDLLVTVKRVSIGRGTRLYACRDVTEREQAHRRLRESQGRLQAMFDNSLDALLLTDDALQCVDANPAACELLGYSREELARLSLADLSPRAESAELEGDWRSHFTPGGEAGYRRLRRKDGGQRDVEFRAVADAAPGLHMLSMRDVTGRRQAEAALRESEERYRRLVQLSPLAIAVYGEGRLLFANPACAALLGAPSPAALAGRPLADLSHPDLQETLAATLPEFEPGSATHTGRELRLTLANGREADIEAYAAPITVGGRRARMLVARDVTEQKSREAALRRSEQRFAAIFRASPILISISTLADGRLLDVNPQWSELFGYAREEIDGRTSLELGLWEDAGDRRRLVKQLEQSGAVRNAEVTFKTRTGNIVHGLESIERIDLEGERQPLLLSMIVDISERRQAEAALRESEARYRELVTLLPDAVVVHASGQLLYANQAAAQMFGVATADELTGGTQWKQIVPTPGAPGWAGPLGHETPLERRGPEESTVLFPDGRLRHIDSASALIQYHGQAARLVVARDVTERRQREEALRRSEERFAKIFHASPHAASLTTTAEGRVLQANQRCLDFYGYTAEEMLGRTTAELGIWGSADERRLALEQMRQAGALRNQELTYRTRSGEERHALISMEWLRLEGESDPVILGMSVDITERKRMEEQQRQTAQRLETLAELSGALAAVSTNFQATLDRIAERTAEIIGDGCVLALVRDDRRWLDLAAFAHRQPEAAELMQRILAGRPRPAREGMLGQVIRSGQGLWLREPDQAWLRATLEPDFLPYLEAHGLASLLIAPLLAGGQVIGTLALTRDRGGTPYREEDEAYLRALADRAALAIANVRLFEHVREGRARQQALARRLVETQETERGHIARELHDEVGQWLTGLQLTLAMAERTADGPARKHIGEAQALTNEVLRRVRDLSLTVRPAMLDDLGLLPTLVWHSERYTAQTGIRATVQHSGLEDRRFSGAIETAAYRIVQEALTNAARHAQVEEVTVRLWADSERLGVQVEDRGLGFDPQAGQAAAGSAGLAGMRERAGLLGGKVTIEATPGRGTRVTAELPLAGTLERRGERASPPGAA